MFAVKLANFFMFLEENTVKCSEGSSDILGNGRNTSFRESSVAFGNLPKKSGIVVKWPKTP